MLFVGDDWAEDHHDVELVDDQGRILARRCLPKALSGVTKLHALVAEYAPEEWAASTRLRRPHFGFTDIRLAA